MTYRFIEGHQETWPIRVMCATLEVSPAGAYAWRRRPPSFQEQRREALLVLIRGIHAEVQQRYGSPRIHATLAARGEACSVNTVAQLMRDNDIRAKSARKFRCRTTASPHALPVAENVLDRPFDPGAPNEAWGADITYVPTRAGWRYRAVVADRYARKVVGWSMAATMESRLVVDALEMAVKRRLPGEGLVAHSDRGSPYASAHYQLLLGKHGITCSMSAVAQCGDNAPAESFFASLKKARTHHEDYQTSEEARAGRFEYIEVFDNNQRLHSSLGYVTPAAYEQSR